MATATSFTPNVTLNPVANVVSNNTVPLQLSVQGKRAVELGLTGLLSFDETDISISYFQVAYRLNQVIYSSCIQGLIF